MVRISVVAALAAVVALAGCGTGQPNPAAPTQPTAVAVAGSPITGPGATPAGVAVPPSAVAETPAAPPSVAPPSAPPSVAPPTEPPPPSNRPTRPPEPSASPGGSAPPSYDPGAPRANPDWPGQFSIYRARTHSVQKTDWYCVPTSIQMMFNLIRGESDRSESGQRRYWEYAMANSRYPLRDNGADPAGWVAAMENWGVRGYSVGVSRSMQDALWLAAKRMRLTGRPVGLIVWGDNGRGGHAWVMTGFESTDDPKLTDNYVVSSVQAMGSLWPYGTINGQSFDPGPKEWVGYRELRQKFTRFDYSPAPAWDGRWITVLP